MYNNSYLQRAGTFITEGIQVGVISALLSSILYSLLLIVSIIASLSLPIIPSSQELDLGSATLTVFFFGGIAMCVIGVVPSLVVGILGGATIGFVLSLWRKKVQGILASLVGLFVGIIFISFGYYLSWLWNVPFPSQISFLEYLSPPSSFNELYDGNVFFVPSVIAILVSSYMGWRINKVSDATFSRME